MVYLNSPSLLRGALVVSTGSTFSCVQETWVRILSEAVFFLVLNSFFYIFFVGWEVLPFYFYAQTLSTNAVDSKPCMTAVDIYMSSAETQEMGYRVYMGWDDMKIFSFKRPARFHGDEVSKKEHLCGFIPQRSSRIEQGRLRDQEKWSCYETDAFHARKQEILLAGSSCCTHWSSTKSKYRE